MKKLNKLILGLSLVASTGLFAQSNQMNNMDHSTMNHSQAQDSRMNMAYHNEMMTRDDFRVVMSTEKPFVSGNNSVDIMISHMDKMIDNAQVKVKFFMPEMPGMPYMEHKANATYKEGKYNCDVNLGMSGTWQYQLKFRTPDGEVRTVRGSVNN